MAVLYADTYLYSYSGEALRCAIFWKWFTTQFEAKNNLFVSTTDTQLSISELRELWFTIHSPQYNCVTPSDYVIHNILNHARDKHSN
ncbi:MAG: hypothetical protein M9958_00370 [Chitinophagales bacterium]|nr:hypothetical protein [Chitinophagales bacterium]